ncbi:MAG: hypothetical protein ATN32_02920 [Candidatus Epulonipiscium fishelsonii]|nr:MAG: hypothetical protein ATN32_02920 [Epulopiscium sp. AS2M-Bin002]
MTHFIKLYPNLSMHNLNADLQLTLTYLMNKFETSESDNFADKNGEVCLIYTRANLAQTLNRTRATVGTYMKKLVSLGFVREKRQGQGKPNLIYIIFDKFMPERQSNNNSDDITPSSNPKSSYDILEGLDDITPSSNPKSSYDILEGLDDITPSSNPKSSYDIFEGLDDITPSSNPKSSYDIFEGLDDITPSSNPKSSYDIFEGLDDITPSSNPKSSYDIFEGLDDITPSSMSNKSENTLKLDKTKSKSSPIENTLRLDKTAGKNSPNIIYADDTFYTSTKSKTRAIVNKAISSLENFDCLDSINFSSMAAEFERTSGIDKPKSSFDSFDSLDDINLSSMSTEFERTSRINKPKNSFDRFEDSDNINLFAMSPELKRTSRLDKPNRLNNPRTILDGIVLEANTLTPRQLRDLQIMAGVKEKDLVPLPPLALEDALPPDLSDFSSLDITKITMANLDPRERIYVPTYTDMRKISALSTSASKDSFCDFVRTVPPTFNTPIEDSDFYQETKNYFDLLLKIIGRSLGEIKHIHIFRLMYLLKVHGLFMGKKTIYRVGKSTYLKRDMFIDFILDEENYINVYRGYYDDVRPPQLKR